MMKKIAVVLSGCGFKDGAEITEAVSSLIALGQTQAEYQCYAPGQSFSSTSHSSEGDTGERNILEESARICRGQIKELSQLKENDYDALLLPGGFGVALHLCNWAHKGAQCEVSPTMETIIKDFHQASKPIGAVCIAPALVARVLGKENITVTIGKDIETAAEIEKTGAIHEPCEVTDFVSDRAHKVITTPAYMFETQPHLAFQGIKRLVGELVEMC